MHYNSPVEHKFDLETVEAIEEAFQETANKWGCIITVCWNNKHSVFAPKKDENPVLPGLWESASFPRLEDGE